MCRTILLVSFLSCTLVAACAGGAGSVLEKDLQPDAVDVHVADLPAAPDTAPDSAPDLLPDALVPDLPPDTTPDSACTDGCFGMPCESGDDCLSGLCVMHLGQSVCTITCEEECPAGWDCVQVSSPGADLLFACVSRFPHLCLPCGSDDDCKSSTAQDSCVVYPGIGKFCAAACNAQSPCPEGYQCAEALTAAGTASFQCLAQAGICDCTTTAVALGLSTPCEWKNALGACKGKRICTAQGLTQCDAHEPKPEACNGLDDDCDAQTDEAACDDSNPCTDDACAPLTGCSSLPVTGPPCDDGDPCTTGDACAQGNCSGTAVKCNDGNPCTDDLCHPVTGCSFQDNLAPCDDGDPCTIGDHCQQAACAAGPKLACDDFKPCTTDSCDPAQGCQHNPIAPCCGNGIKEGAEQCDDGNNKSGDGCSADCKNESACPAGTAYVKGYCWVKAIEWCEPHANACARFGKSPTAKMVDMTWDNSTLSQVAATWGYTSIGKYECCAQAMWCNDGAKQCGTHNFGNQFDNYNCYPSGPSWWPVYTCNP